MLSRSEVDKYGPPGFHVAQKEKDYVQHWILTFLSRAGFTGVFKGGTCLQKTLGLPRYSEDLDFTLNNASEPDFEAISAFLSSAGFSNLTWKKESSDISSSARLRYQGPLYSGSSISEGTVLLEFSKREKTLLEPLPALIKPPYPDLLPYQILAMNVEEIAAEKIRALSTRTSARDLFDLYFLLHKNTLLRRKLVDSKLAYYKLEFDFKHFEKNVEKLRSIWRKEITAFTPITIDYDLVSALVFSKTKIQLT